MSDKFLVGIAAIIIKDKKVLLFKHTYQFFWGLPGGYLKIHENFRQSIEREIKEEVGLEVVMKGILDIHKIKNRPAIDIVVFCDVLRGSIKVDKEEVEKADFFAYGDIPDDFKKHQPQHYQLVKSVLS
jgi:ADP-ribose pyrophosphatase YjhB (NUDIX family)